MKLTSASMFIVWEPATTQFTPFHPKDLTPQVCWDFHWHCKTGRQLDPSGRVWPPWAPKKCPWGFNLPHLTHGPKICQQEGICTCEMCNSRFHTIGYIMLSDQIMASAFTFLLCIPVPPPCVCQEYILLTKFVTWVKWGKLHYPRRGGVIWRPPFRPDLVSVFMFLLCTPIVLSTDQVWSIGEMG